MTPIDGTPSINANRPGRWKADIAESVDLYNAWFMQFAPKAYRDTRVATTKKVELALGQTADLTDIGPHVLRRYPSVLPILRMATAPPIARDRLIGLAGVSRGLVHNMEVKRRVSSSMGPAALNTDLKRIEQTIEKLIDRDVFPWLGHKKKPGKVEVRRAATIVADRLCGAEADPIIRNAQERRQLAAIKYWLEKKGYSSAAGKNLRFDRMKPGTFAFRLNIPVRQPGRSGQVNIPVDVAVKPLASKRAGFPVLIEAKSAGDFTNTNKRRKEEATKITQLKHTYGKQVWYILFLCGYFDSGYLGYEAAEGIDWVWEHRMDDLLLVGF